MIASHLIEKKLRTRTRRDVYYWMRKFGSVQLVLAAPSVSPNGGASDVSAWVVPALTFVLGVAVTEWRHSRRIKRQKRERAKSLVTVLLRILDELKVGDQVLRDALGQEDVGRITHAFERVDEPYPTDLHEQLQQLHLVDLELFSPSFLESWTKLKVSCNKLRAAHTNLRASLQSEVLTSDNSDTAGSGDDATRLHGKLRNYRYLVDDTIENLRRSCNMLRDSSDPETKRQIDDQI